jgi:hypothetical protein
MSIEMDVKESEYEKARRELKDANNEPRKLEG